MDYILFGASKAGSQYLKILNALEYRVIAFTDNDAAKWGTEFEGVAVISVDEAVNSGALILIASMYNYEIAAQLEKKGFHNFQLNINMIISDLNDAQRDRIGQVIEGMDNCKINPCYSLCDEIIDVSEDCEILFVAHSYPLPNSQLTDSFLSSRVREYNKSGKKVAVLAFDEFSGLKKWSLHGTTVYTGDGHVLERIIKKNNYKKFLIHFVNEAILFHINKIRPDAEINIWVHGVEAISWRRRIFNYSEKELVERSRLLDRQDVTRMKFMKGILENSNYKFVFVSEWLKSAVEEDASCKTKNFEIIHNPINISFFKHKEKPLEQRFNVLKIKSFSSRVYANDITNKTIIELSKRDGFNKMSFELYGDGLLFLEEMKELLECDFENVHIYQKFLTREEVYEAHKRNGVFLCPTRQDSQGVSMGEAMSSGLVVVTNRVAAIPEFIDSGCGMLCENESFIEMADAIEMLCQNPSMFSEMSKKASERVSAQCSHELIIRKELSVIG